MQTRCAALVMVPLPAAANAPDPLVDHAREISVASGSTSTMGQKMRSARPSHLNARTSSLTQHDVAEAG
jgi:hypothetical protein